MLQNKVLYAFVPYHLQCLLFASAAGNQELNARKNIYANEMFNLRNIGTVIASVYTPTSMQNYWLKNTVIIIIEDCNCFLLKNIFFFKRSFSASQLQLFVCNLYPSHNN